MSGPSEKAIEAGRLTAQLPEDALRTLGQRVEDALRAAHAPALGLDRSVCLRDVVEALKARHPERRPGEHHAADFLEHEFGGQG